MSTEAERRLAYRLAQPKAPLVLRTWHAAQITEGEYSGLRGFLIRVCEHGNGLDVKIVGCDLLVCCVPLSWLTGALTLHGGAWCAGSDCTEGDALNPEGTA